MHPSEINPIINLAALIEPAAVDVGSGTRIAIIVPTVVAEALVIL